MRTRVLLIGLLLALPLVVAAAPTAAASSCEDHPVNRVVCTVNDLRQCVRTLLSDVGHPGWPSC